MATSDAEENKAAGILAYILFFVPLLMAPKSRFARYHANQGLLLLIVAVAVNIIGTIIPFLGWLVILPVGMIAVFTLLVIGIINASNGVMKPLPIIGNYEIIK